MTHAQESKDLLANALRLNVEDRAELASELLASLGGSSDPELRVLPATERALAIAARGARKYRNALRELAK